MVIDVKQNPSNQVLTLLARSDLGHEVGEIQQCSNVGGDGFPHRYRLAHSMVAYLIAFLLQH